MVVTAIVIIYEISNSIQDSNLSIRDLFHALQPDVHEYNDLMQSYIDEGIPDYIVHNVWDLYQWD